MLKSELQSFCRQSSAFRTGRRNERREQKKNVPYGGDYFWFNNGAEERLPFRGGYWYYGGDAGLFYLNLGYPRGSSNWSIGGRSAFVELPAES